ncbi:hypothetical protein JK359_33495 [Streptomyces actinomycinicus]|uniref:Uncharacterized protein n=1 Tax=Streptomyces actinomycinicus TaxID=1695166 RepID=A0A937EQS1_9ACTN|nr:hypothetical protein [Streptomyces actinomycinicus]MBL1086822.1 hypothetical protein [Streptomyces actinomycinicus]
MTLTSHATTSTRPGATHRAYNPTPSIPLLITELAQEDFWARYAKIRGDAEHFTPAYLAARETAALLLRAVIADLFALADPTNPIAAADAAAAANALRRKSRQMQLPAEAARAWLREEYEAWRNDAPHPPNCPGHCGGTGIVMETTTWQNDGAPVWAEPADCRRGEEDDPHFDDCLCRGTGRRWNAEYREYERCDRYTPDPDCAQPEPRAGEAWSAGPYGEEPF